METWYHKYKLDLEIIFSSTFFSALCSGILIWHWNFQLQTVTAPHWIVCNNHNQLWCILKTGRLDWLRMRSCCTVQSSDGNMVPWICLSMVPWFPPVKKCKGVQKLRVTAMETWYHEYVYRWYHDFLMSKSVREHRSLEWQLFQSLPLLQLHVSFLGLKLLWHKNVNKNYSNPVWLVKNCL